MRHNSTTDSNNTRDKLVNKKSDFLIDALHLFVLFSFALAQPLFDILSRYPEFFVSRKSEPIDIILFILTLCLFLPGMAVLLEAASGIFGRRIRKAVHWFMVATLVAVIALQVLKKVFGFPGIFPMILSAVLGISATIAYVRLRPAKIFLTVLCPVIVIFPGLFLFNSPVHKVVFPEKDPFAIEIKIDNPAPIIMVVFDELPVISLMDERRRIDPILYPNFIDLAQDSYWFRNVASVSGSTTHAIPAILSGLYPHRNGMPTAAEYPHTLFTLLGGSYEMHVYESDTMLCPETLCGDKGRPKGLSKRMASMLTDLSIVYLHMGLPEDFTTRLPSVTQVWKDFLGKSDKDDSMTKGALSYKDRPRLFMEFVESIKATEKPALYFLHIMLPHVPWSYLPSGKTYGEMRTGMPGLDIKKEMWDDDDWLVIQGYQRHLLQVGFVDSLLGALLSRLKALDLYDSSMIVITADHGCNFLPGKSRRGVVKGHRMDLLGVPLLIKAPHQEKGVVSDCQMESIDILPTIAEILHVPIPWAVDGRSVLSPDMALRANQSAKSNITGTDDELGSGYKSQYESVKRKVAVFGSGTKRDGLFRIGPHNEFEGKDLSELTFSDDSRVDFELIQAGLYDNVDPASPFIPARIRGVIMPGKAGEEMALAISVNGTIRALTRSYSNKDGVQKFSAIVPEVSFRKGKNDIEVFITPKVDERRSSIHIPAGTATRYSSEPSSKTTREVITSLDSTSVMPVAPNPLKGYLDIARVKNNQIEFSGWAADVKNAHLPEAIKIFLDRKLLYSGSCNVDRPDVAKAYGNPALKRAGFRYHIPLSSLGDLPNSEVHIFALFKSGVEVELQYPKGYKWGKK